MRKIRILIEFHKMWRGDAIKLICGKFYTGRTTKRTSLQSAKFAEEIKRQKFKCLNCLYKCRVKRTNFDPPNMSNSPLLIASLLKIIENKTFRRSFSMRKPLMSTKSLLQLATMPYLDISCSTFNQRGQCQSRETTMMY